MPGTKADRRGEADVQVTEMHGAPQSVELALDREHRGVFVPRLDHRAPVSPVNRVSVKTAAIISSGESIADGWKPFSSLKCCGTCPSVAA
jgi:hypothetical protein